MSKRKKSTQAPPSAEGSAASQSFVARQPILNRGLETHGYELLFRNGIDNFFRHDDGDHATMSVMSNAYLGGEVLDITGGKRAFINCTRYLLLHDYAELLPRESVVLEILETVEPDDPIVEACYRLKNAGYTLALDDFEYTPAHDPLVALADIIKVDFLQSGAEERRAMAETFIPMGVELLAEKVETQADYEEACELGYKLFQGYFFSKPTVVSTRQVPESRLSRMQLLQQVNHSDFDIDQAEAIVKHDAVLSMKLLKYINSAGFGVRQEVRSIRQALTLLGQRNLRRWLMVLVLTGLSEDKPQELLRQAIVRARFCEGLAAGSSHHELDEQELFLVGLFSMMDAFMDCPMEKLLEGMPVTDAVRKTLLGGATLHRSLLDLAAAYEHADWDTVSAVAAAREIDEESLPALHRDALEWADELAKI